MLSKAKLKKKKTFADSATSSEKRSTGFLVEYYSISYVFHACMDFVFQIRRSRMAHRSFFCLDQVRLLKTKPQLEGNLQFWPYYTIIVT